MLTNETPFVKRVALRAFSESLSKASITLVEAKEAYRAAQENHKTLSALVEELIKEGITLDENVTTTHQASDAPSVSSASSAAPTQANRKKPIAKKTKKVSSVRELIMDVIKGGNSVVRTKDILAKVRASQGKDYPAPTVSGALSRLVEDNILHRVRDDKSNTSTYGLPEWFDGDTAKDEHTHGY